MDESLYPRLIELLRAALDLPAHARAMFVQQQCADDSDLRATLMHLLQLDARSGLALDTPALIAAAGLLTSAVNAQPTQHIGPFVLLRQLGEGGMGAVWLAERGDGGFAQQVALKLIRFGANSAGMQMQFRRERELLARLSHPDIARLLDGGVDAQGRLWYAMEYIQGMDLREWIDTTDADAPTRLRLFARLARAVAYAHQHLIVHRDLKPSNVLVRGDGTPCLLDFGIARLIDADAAEQTLTAQRFVTCAYAAPEQLRGEPTTTATDVYALGVLLFELLTGLHFAALHSDGSATRPSTALLRHPEALHAALPPARLRGDLDAIVLRALADEPLRRYVTAQALAEDVENVLHGRAVRARPDSGTYRFGKLVRRNPWASAAFACAILALLGGIAASGWQLRRAQAEADHARISLRQAEAIHGFIQSLLLNANPNYAKGSATTIGELLAPAQARVIQELGGEPVVAAALLTQIGEIHDSLEQDGLARQAMQEALKFNQRAAQPSLRVEGTAQAYLAYADYLKGDSVSALRELQATVDQLRVGGADVRAVLAKALILQASVLFANDRQTQALALEREALQILQSLGEAQASEYVGQLTGYADMAAGMGRNDEALNAAQRALDHPLMRANTAPALRANALGAKARALQSLGRNAEAEPLALEVIADFSALFGAGNARTYYWRYRHAQILQALGHLDSAQSEVDALIAVPAPDDQPVAPVAYALLGAQLAQARHSTDAAQRAAVALRLGCGKDGNARFCASARKLNGKPQD